MYKLCKITTYLVFQLLRRFSDLMLGATLPDEEKQTCSICFEELLAHQCSRYFDFAIET